MRIQINAIKYKTKISNYKEVIAFITYIILIPVQFSNSFVSDSL